MNAEGLLAHYGRIADAPDAIVRLRRFVLDLAVRGKLVAQHLEDEPAAKLVEKIHTEKSRLAKLSEGKLERSSSIDCEPVFDIPKSWEWVPATFPAIVMSDLGKKIQTKSVLEAGKFPVIDQGKVFIRGYCNDESKVTRVDCPLILFGDHTRETKLIDFDFVIGADGVKLLKPVCIFARYYFMALQWLPLDSRGYGRHFKLLRASAITLPPLAEQERIVAKVDELMALCDQLEAARAQREATRDRLAAASLARLNAPDPDTFHADARFALDALTALTTRPDQIKQLRQTILNLAVRGKLVPQNPRDEPACSVLKRLLAAKRAQRDAAKKARNGSRLEAVHEEGAFDLPGGWTWASTLEVCSHVDSGSTPPAADMKEGHGDIPFIKVYNLTKMGDLDFSVKPTYISEETHRTRLARSKIVPNDVLMNIVGPPLGKVSIVPPTFPEWNTNQAVVLFRPLPELLPKYLAICLMSTSVLSWIIDLAQQTVGQVNISVGKSRRLPIPFPPTAEQHRIVAKVDELMALCDQLEASLTTGETTRSRLLDALLHEALAPAEQLAA